MFAETHCDPTSVSPPEDEENVRPYKGRLVLARQMVSHMEIIKMGTDLSDLSFESIFYHWNLFSSSHSICQVFASVFVFLTPCLCPGGILSWLSIQHPYKNADYSLPMCGWTRHNTRKMKH